MPLQNPSTTTRARNSRLRMLINACGLTSDAAGKEEELGLEASMGKVGEIRNPKSEIRKKSEIRIPNVCGYSSHNRSRREILNSDFGLRISFGFRASDFGFSFLPHFIGEGIVSNKRFTT